MNGFTEKDVHCIARHIAAYLESERDEVAAYHYLPCPSCPYNMTCTPYPHVVSPEESFAKLFSVAGVKRPRRYRIRRPDEWDGARENAGGPHARN
jgi:hypothetical protein